MSSSKSTTTGTLGKIQLVFAAGLFITAGEMYVENLSLPLIGSSADEMHIPCIEDGIQTDDDNRMI